MSPEDMKTTFVILGFIGNLGGMGVAGFFVKKWIARQETDIKNLRSDATREAVRLFDKIDDVFKCMSGIKVNVEKKADRDYLDAQMKEQEKRLRDHKHTCCIDKDPNVFFQH